MTCKDCIHYDVCQYHIDEETDMTVAECGKFKNKADFVEVPCRCKKCRYGKLMGDHKTYVCIRQTAYKKADDYCSSGKRRE